MKARELIELLTRYDPEVEVVLATDTEGNGVGTIATYCLGHFVPDDDVSAWGEFYDDDGLVDAKEDYEQYFQEPFDEPIPALLLSPGD